MQKRSFVYIVALLVALLEVSLVANMRIGGLAPHFVVILLASMVLLRFEAAFYWQVALFVGVILDIFASGHFGFTALSFALAAGAVYALRNSFARQIPILSLVLYASVGSIMFDGALSLLYQASATGIVWFIVGDAFYTVSVASLLWVLRTALSSSPSHKRLDLREGMR